MKTININEKNNGKKLNNILQREFPALSLNTIYKALRKKDIRVNDIRINENITLHTGDVVKVFIADEFLFANKSNITTFENSSYSSVNIPVIYEDGNILIVDKPAEIEVWISGDDKEYRKVGECSYTKNEIFREGVFREDIPFEIGTEARYVRVVARGAGDCPFTHVRPGQEARIYFDEIIIE